MELLSGAERPLTDLSGRPGNLGSYALDTDGHWVYFTCERNVGAIELREKGSLSAR